MSNEFFISYNRKDKIFVQLLFKKFKDVGIDPWIDALDIPAASYWRQEVAVGIQAARDFIFCLSPDSTTSEECQKELEHALALGKRIIPLVIRPTPTNLVHPALREVNWIFIEPDFDEAFKALLSVLEAPQGFTYGDRLDSKIEVSSDDTVRVFPLYRNYYLLGRSPRVEGTDSFEGGLIKISSKDPYVSKVSATLRLIDNRWYLGDGFVTFNKQGTAIGFVSSRNGNFINGKKQPPRSLYPLRHKDFIQVSKSTNFTYLELRPSDEEPGDNSEDARETWV